MRKSLTPGSRALATEKLLRILDLNTICKSACCPNRDECYSKKTVTFLILGDSCTRGCRHCSVGGARPVGPDSGEPRRIRDAVKRLGLEHVVVTSVTRDDLEDEGLGHFADVVRELSSLKPRPTIELLTPDFRRTQEAAVACLSQLPIDIFSHNIETVRRIFRLVKHKSDYDASLSLLRRVADRKPSFYIKSGAMLGMGESREEILKLLGDLRGAGCQMLTLGQYLKSKPRGFEVQRYVTPDEFEGYKRIGYNIGLSWIESGPFVRSSYRASDSFKQIEGLVTHA